MGSSIADPWGVSTVKMDDGTVLSKKIISAGIGTYVGYRVTGL